MRRVKYLFLFHPIHTALTAGSAWKSSGLLRGLTGLVLNPGCTLTQCPFPLSNFNKQSETRFSMESGWHPDSPGQGQCKLVCHDWLHPMHLGGYVCACVNTSMCPFAATWAHSRSIRMGVPMSACVFIYVGSVD